MIEPNDETHPAQSFATGGSAVDTLRELQPAVTYESRANWSSGDSSPDRAIELSRMLTGIVQDLVQQLDDQEIHSKVLEKRLATLDSASEHFEATRIQLREAVTGSITREDLEAMQRALQALTQDPNHIMVLAAVAQQASKLLAVTNNFARVQELLG